MKKFFIVTITDSKGIKSYKLNESIKKILKNSVVITVIYILISVAALIFLGKSYVHNRNLAVTNRELKKFKTEYDEKQRVEKERENKVINMSNINETPEYKRDRILRMIPSSYPVNKNTRITSPYGERVHPVSGVVKGHTGLDFGTGMLADIHSTADGVVTFAGVKGGYGNAVVIDHGFGFQTLYGHMDSYSVEMNQFVGKDQVIGKSGNTGVSTGPHLHYEVLFYGRRLDPINFVKWDKEHFEKKKKK